MKLKYITLTLLFIFNSALASSVQLMEKELDLYDLSRNRLIPIIIVSNKDKITNKLPLVVISHGYTIKNTEYSFIANKLASFGYVVVSIQHDLSSDPQLPKVGNIYKKRKPLWDRGAQNILFVLNKLKQQHINAKLDDIILIGHSNGGDISMLFATKYPNLVSKVISLDSLRMPFPKNKHIKILSIRANDTKADEGVLPNKKDEALFGMKIVSLEKVKHIELSDRGTEAEKKSIDDIILNFLNTY